MKLAPIVLFVYNRPWHTKKTVEALKKNKLARDSELFVFSDAPKNNSTKLLVSEVRHYVKKIDGFKNVNIVERKNHLGLADSVISGVTEIIDRYEKVIVMEDDLVSSAAFLSYMNNFLDFYKIERKVFGITGYNYPKKLMKIPVSYKDDIYFNTRAGSWGWATWEDRWNKADWKVSDYSDFKNNHRMRKLFNSGGDDMSNMLDYQMKGIIDSWAIRWCFTLFKNDGLFIYPVKSYIDNIGLDGSGVHCGKSRRNKYKNICLNNKINLKFPQKIALNKNMMNNFKKINKKNIVKEIVFKLIKNTRLYEYYSKIKSK